MINDKLLEIYNSIPIEERQFSNDSHGIAALLYDYLKMNKINKTELAEKMGKRQSVITKWLSGGHNFTLETLSELEAKLNIKFFIFNEDNKLINNRPLSKTYIDDNSAMYCLNRKNEISVSVTSKM